MVEAVHNSASQLEGHGAQQDQQTNLAHDTLMETPFGLSPLRKPLKWLKCSGILGQ